FWYAEQWFTIPWQFTEFVFPDIRGADVRDLYLLTSSFFDQQAIHWLWDMNATQEPLTQTMELGDRLRVHFWYNQNEGGKKYKDPNGLRIYGENGYGAGDATVLADPISGSPVEVPPYTDPWAPFNPQLPQAPIKDSITFNPAYMDEFLNTGEELVPLYEQIAIENNNAREKVFPRMWYEPEYLDKILYGEVGGGSEITATDVYTFPAVMQEFTYMLLDTANNPSNGQPGTSSIAFPVGATATQLPAPSSNAPFGLPPHMLPSFGYGLTSFDADFNGTHDIVRVHSEASLAALTGIGADFDGDGTLDDLDTDGTALSGDELALFTVGALEVGIGDSVQFLDQMVTLENITAQGGGQAQLQLWYTGGGLHAMGGGLYSLHPDNIGPATALNQGDMVIAGRDRVNVQRIPAGGNNLGTLYGPWFVWVADIDTTFDTVTLIVGRALGATHSAIDDGVGYHDMEPGDPWYLKRFFVDGHEYNVVALHTVPGDPAAPYPYEFSYITIRTPVPKQTFVNTQDSQVLQGYFLPQGAVWGVDTHIISVMPPFNFNHTIAPDIVALDEWMEGQEPNGEFANPDFYDPDCASLGLNDIRAASPMIIRINEEDRDPQFFGEIKELAYGTAWRLRQFHTLPDQYTDLRLPREQLYLLTSSWLSEESLAHFYACGLDITTQDDLAGANAGIPLANSTTITGTGYYDPPDDWQDPAELLRVKMWYDPATAEDIYVNTRTLAGTEFTIDLDQGWNLISFPILPFDPSIAQVMSALGGLYDRVLGFHCGVGGLSYDPSLPAGISTLHQMDGYHGYWVRMNSAATLTVTGWRIPANSPLYLCQGWNLTSYLPNLPLPVSNALASLDPFYTVVLGFDGGGLSYYPDLPAGMNTLQNMAPGFGYWVRLNRNGTLAYPTGVAMAAEALPNAVSLLDGVTPSTQWVTVVSLDSQAKGQPLPEGALVQAYDQQGTLAGQCNVMQAGKFVMSVYGDDPWTADVDEGAEAGELLTFLVDGEPVYVLGPDAPIWTEMGDRLDLNLSDALPRRVFVPAILK
ncbi:MAG: hypothetical protein GX605_04055, partial [Chloroflexi bacterium]|nr:hypothetical protein [Chloroflexota bacterium]